MSKKMLSGTLLAGWLLLLLASGCSAANNYLRPEDFASYLERDGVKVDHVRQLSPAPFLATSGAGLLISGSEIGVYKYDQTSEIQAERIAHLAETGRAYVNGIVYPVEVYGSFMFFGLDKNPKKREILRTIHRFK